VSGSRVVKLAPEVGERLRARLEALDYRFGEVPHAVWNARGEDAVVTYYRSGKLVVAGKGANAFVEGRLGWEPDEKPEAVSRRVVGIDEAGKGDYFGPLVVAAVLATPENADDLARAGVRDSKDLSDAPAHRIAERIRAVAPHAVVAIGPARYNQLRDEMGNLNRLLAWGHARAAADLLAGETADEALSDQFAKDERVLLGAFERAGLDIPLRQRTRAESHLAVAAASILARDGFLTRLRRLGEEIDETLPKGAGAPVDRAIRALVKVHGREVLPRLAKVHFRNTAKVLESLF
jgi:ribonuclease HIII